jgi:hypothetical protein
MNSITIKCPSCSSTFPALPNSKTACPRCGQSVIVEAPADAVTGGASSAAARSKLTVPVLALIAGLVGGYFAGREHLKYEIRSTFQNAAKGMADAFTEPIKAKAPVKTESREEKAYIDQSLALSGVRARYETDALDRTKAIVRATLKNNGEKTIKKLKVTAYFLDAEGNVISEDSYHPILEESVNGDSVLKPHYIREFGFKADYVPSQWKEGKARVAITEIEFAP